MLVYLKLKLFKCRRDHYHKYHWMMANGEDYYRVIKICSKLHCTTFLLVPDPGVSIII